MRYLINENNPPPQRLRVHFSSKLNGDIRTIVDYNKENVVALKTWKDYIKSVKLYVGDHVIAWDDMPTIKRRG